MGGGEGGEGYFVYIFLAKTKKDTFICMYVTSFQMKLQ